MANIPRLRAVLMHDTMQSTWIQPLIMVLYIGHISQAPEVSYCYYKLPTNVIRTVNSIFFVIPVVYGLIYLSANQHSGLKPPSLYHRLINAI